MNEFTLITVSVRPKNIPIIGEEIERQKSEWPNLKWMIVFDFEDTKENKKLSSDIRFFLDNRKEWISYEFKPHPANKSSGGNHGKDYLIKKIKTGWIYQLDDDNNIYTNFISEVKSLINRYPAMDLFCFWQENRYHPKSLKDIRVGIVDAAMYVFNKNICEGIDYPLSYGGDGLFIKKMIDKDASKVWIEQKYLCTYNKLKNMEICNLGNIAIECNSDKQSRHNYCCIYEQLFASYKEQEISLLELGVFRGGSIKMWRKWFSKAKIYGVDNERDFKIPQFDLENTNIIKANTQTIEICDSLGWSKFDIIIDDADHHPYSQLRTIWNLWPLLKEKGIYVIEDVQNFDKWKDHWKFINAEVFDQRKSGSYDSVMLVIRKN